MAAFLQRLNRERLMQICRRADEHDVKIALRDHVRPVGIRLLHAEFACRHGATLLTRVSHRHQLDVLMIQQQLSMGTPHVAISNQTDFNHE